MGHPVPDERWASLCGKYAAVLIEPLRAVAKTHGYALAVHGTLRRDIDLIAAPWTDEAVAPPVLAEAIRAEAERVSPNGLAIDRDRTIAANPDHFANGCVGGKPHGRLTWTFHLGGGPYIDLSVFQPWTDAQHAEQLDAIRAAAATYEPDE